MIVFVYICKIIAITLFKFKDTNFFIRIKPKTKNFEY